MRSLLVLSLFFAAACSPSVHVTRLAATPYAARASDYPIAIFREARPRCPFDELAVVSARPMTMFQVGDALIETLRVKAREIGGDAITGLTLDASYSGTVIRYKSADCRE